MNTLTTRIFQCTCTYLHVLLSVSVHLSMFVPRCVYASVGLCLSGTVSDDTFIYTCISLYLPVYTMYTLVPVRVYVCGYVYVCVRTVDTSVHACASMYVSRSLCKHTYRSPWRDKKQGYPSIQWRAPGPLTPNKKTRAQTRVWPSSTRQGRPQDPTDLCPLLGRGWRKGGHHDLRPS